MTTLLTSTTSTTGYVLTPDTTGTLVLKTGSGAGTTALTLDASQNATFAGNVIGVLKSVTAVASTSGTSIDFTGIPAYAKRITVMFNGVSTSGTAFPLVQLGSGSVTTSGYLCNSLIAGSTNIASGLAFTAGFGLNANAAVNLMYGHITFTLISGSTWVGSGVVGVNSSGTIYVATCGGNVTLGGALDRIRITTTNGTDTFDAGSINILWE